MPLQFVAGRQTRVHEIEIVGRISDHPESFMTAREGRLSTTV